MEKSIVSPGRKPSLRNRTIKVLFPGRFSFIHAGHRTTITDIKSAFKNISLTVAVLEDQLSPSLLKTEEKVLTFKSFPEVDNVVVLQKKPLEKDLIDWGFDLLATSRLGKYEGVDRVLKIEKKHGFSSSCIIAKILQDSDKHCARLVAQGVPRSQIKISRLAELSIKAKVKVASVRKALARGPSSSSSVTKAMEKIKSLLYSRPSFWSPSRNQVLRSWLEQTTSPLPSIQSLLYQIWEAA